MKSGTSGIVALIVVLAAIVLGEPPPDSGWLGNG